MFSLTAIPSVEAISLIASPISSEYALSSTFVHSSLSALSLCSSPMMSLGLVTCAFALTFSLVEWFSFIDSKMKGYRQKIAAAISACYLFL